MPDKAVPNYQCEVRLHMLYDLLKLGVYPWMWDEANYGEDNKDMIGCFYNEDIENIRILKRMGL